MTKLVAVILAGGSGTRLWPVSRQNRPKQFIALFSEHTMLEETIRRLHPMIAREDVTVVTSKALANGEAHHQLADFARLLEPCARNTAPAIGLSALAFVIKGEDPVIAVLPSDHLIADEDGFRARLGDAIVLAERGDLVTFGIYPTHPETGYGYIQVQAQASMAANGLAVPVTSFKEKPDLPTAEAFLAAGNYFWNSGMFVWKATAILRAIQAHLPELHKVLEKIRDDVANGAGLQTAIDAHFASCPNISIDHGVLESVATTATAVTSREVQPKLMLVPANIGWSDVGSWDAVYALSDKESDGNVLRGNCKVMESTNTLIHAESRLVVGLGVSDLLVIETPTAVLVARRGTSQKVREVAEWMKLPKTESTATNSAQPHTELTRHHSAQEPSERTPDVEADPVRWRTLSAGQTAALSVPAGSTEIFVGVEGRTQIDIGTTTRQIGPGESISVASGETVRLSNPHTALANLISVRVVLPPPLGSSLGNPEKYGAAH